jgi:hypothetical protein
MRIVSVNGEAGQHDGEGTDEDCEDPHAASRTAATTRRNMMEI